MDVVSLEDDPPPQSDMPTPNILKKDTTPLLNEPGVRNVLDIASEIHHLVANG
jgi:hypothetical protein